MYQVNFSHLVKITFVNLLLVLMILGTARLILLIDIVDVEQLSLYRQDLFKVFFLGGRYDIKVAAIAFALPIVAGLFTASFPHLFKRLLSFFVIYSSVIHFLLIMLSILNYFYYQTYSNHIDVFIFGLKDDDTFAVLQSVWADYPLIKALILTLIGSYFAFLINKHLVQKAPNKLVRFDNLAWNIAFTVIFVGLVFVFARGSLGTHPLKRYHANVSDYFAFNKVTPNAVVLLEWAKTDYKKQATFSSVKKGDFSQKLLEVLGKNSMESTTSKNDYLVENPPHVVIALMESLGSSLLNFDGKDDQLLGNLQPHFSEDFLFPRFYAHTHGTIDTLVDMLVHSNVTSIAASDAQNIAIPEAPMLAYQQAGYRTVFLYGGNAMWRNIYNYFPKQGFDVIYDENTIKRYFPEANDSVSDWGVADEFTFKMATKLLTEATQPTVIYIMTVTNHSPHSIPNTVTEREISIDTRLKSMLDLEGDKLNNMLQSYRYAADVLGNFITGIKGSSLQSNTIVASSGDHRLRSSIMNTDIKRASASQVPFYLYIPSEILAHVNHSYQPLRVGSHKDIFPTLYNFSLSNQKYSSLGGENLLSDNDSVNYWGYSLQGVFTDKGAHLKSMPGKLIPWSGASNQFSAVIDDEEKVTPTASEYNELKTLYINQAVKGNH